MCSLRGGGHCVMDTSTLQDDFLSTVPQPKMPKLTKTGEEGSSPALGKSSESWFSSQWKGCMPSRGRAHTQKESVSDLASTVRELSPLLPQWQLYFLIPYFKSLKVELLNVSEALHLSLATPTPPFPPCPEEDLVPL